MNGTSTAWRNGQLGYLGVLLISRLVGYYAKAAWAEGIADTYRRYRVGRVFSKGKARVFHYSKADYIQKSQKMHFLVQKFAGIGIFLYLCSGF